MDVTERADEMAGRMARQLRVRGTGLAEVTRNAGRRLPRRLRSDAEALIRAEALSGHPKLAHQVDPKRIARAVKRLNRYLERQNPGRERWGAILDRLAAVAFVLVVAVLAVFFTLLRRGYFD